MPRPLLFLSSRAEGDELDIGTTSRIEKGVVLR
jgi:hypothetical protein